MAWMKGQASDWQAVVGRTRECQTLGQDRAVPERPETSCQNLVKKTTKKRS